MRGIKQNALAKSTSPEGFTCAAVVALRGRLHPTRSARKTSVVEDLCVRSRACVGGFGSTADTKCVSPCDDGALFSEVIFEGAKSKRLGEEHQSRRVYVRCGGCSARAFTPCEERARNLEHRGPVPLVEGVRRGLWEHRRHKVCEPLRRWRLIFRGDF